MPRFEHCELTELTASRNYGRTERLRDIWGPILDLNTRIPSSGFLTSQYKIKEVREGLLLTPCEGTKPQAHDKQPLLARRFHGNACCNLTCKQLTDGVQARSITAHK